jgi:hypothetical protein
MKKIYQAPQTHVYAAMGESLLTATSIKIDADNKVNNSGDIGFTKENKAEWSDMWNK